MLTRKIIRDPERRVNEDLRIEGDRCEAEAGWGVARNWGIDEEGLASRYAARKTWRFAEIGNRLDRRKTAVGPKRAGVLPRAGALTKRATRQLSGQRGLGYCRGLGH
jgi:hypothetical protein